MSIRTKIITGFTIAFILLIAVGYAGYFGVNRLVDTFHDLQSQEIRLAQLSDALHISMLTHRRFEKDVLLNIGSADRQADYVTRFQKESAKIRGLMTDIVQIAGADASMPPELQKKAASMQQQFDLYSQGVLDVARQLAANPSLTPQQGNQLIGKFKDATYRIENTIEELVAYSQKTVSTVLQQQQVLSARISSAISIFLAVGAIASLLIMVFVTRSITNPLSRITRFAQTVGRGELDARPEGRFTAELATLCASLESMIAALKQEMAKAQVQTQHALEAQTQAQKAQAQTEEAMRQAEQAKKEGLHQAGLALEAVMGALSTAAEDIARQVHEARGGSHMQQERTGQLASAISQLNDSIHDVARRGEYAASEGATMNNVAAHGMESVETFAASSQKIVAQADVTKSTLDMLITQTEGIGSILSVITDIADQTNLLALNAAIEAARAGEAGRGFAVVADEVRKLAEKTMSATREVGDVVRGIQKETHEASSHMKDSMELILQGEKISLDIRRTVEQVAVSARTSSEEISAIAAAVEQQSSATSLITDNVKEVSSVANKTLNLLEQTERCVDTIASSVTQLQELTARLNTNSL